MIKRIKIIKYSSLALFCVTSVLLFVNESKLSVTNNAESSRELFEDHLQRLNSINQVTEYADSIYSSLNLYQFDTSKYVDICSEIIKRRFYHELSSYTLSENWIAYTCGNLFWSHFSAIVEPEDLLKHSKGICSQQNLVFTELLKKKKIMSRDIGLGTKEGPGHYLTEVWYQGKWHLYDVDIEPNWEIVNFDHLSMDSLMKNKMILYAIYGNKLTKEQINKITENLRYGVPNEFPAKNMLFFHQLSKILTYILPVIFLLVFCITIYKKSGKN